MAADIVEVERQFWRKMLNKARDRLAPWASSDPAGGSPEAEEAAYYYVGALGKCWRWAVAVSEEDMRSLTPHVAMLAMPRIMEFVSMAKADALALRERVGKAEDLQAEERCVDSLACRETIAALSIGVERACTAADQSSPEMADLRDAIDRLNAAVVDLDACLRERLEVLSLAATTYALENWRALLADEFSGELPWWLDGTLEWIAAATRPEGEAAMAPTVGSAATEPQPGAAEAILSVCAAGAGMSPIRRALDRAARSVSEFLNEIQLGCFRPVAAQAVRLAAATGSGFQRQLVSQEGSPFDVEVAQFGNRVHIALNAKPEAGPEYADGLVRLILAEGQAVKLARLMLVKEGRGTCVLDPRDVSVCVPDKQPLSVRVELVSIPQVMEGLGAADSVKALTSLLGDADPVPRRSAVEVLAELGDPDATDAIAKLRNDPDEMVRAAVAAALERLAGS